MDRNEAIERAFDSWWCGMAHPAGAHHPSNMIRSAFKAGHRAALAMPEAKRAPVCWTCGITMDRFNLAYNIEAWKCPKVHQFKPVDAAPPAPSSESSHENLAGPATLPSHARDEVRTEPRSGSKSTNGTGGDDSTSTPAASARSDAEAVRDVRVFGGGQITNSIRRLIATLDDRELGPIVRSMPETVSLAEYLTKSLPLPAPSHESGIVAPCDHAVGVTFYGLPREGNTIDVLGKTFRFVEVKPESGVEKARRELAEAAGREELADYDSDEACGTDQFYVKRDEWTVAMDAVIQKRTELRAAERAAREGKV